MIEEDDLRLLHLLGDGAHTVYRNMELLPSIINIHLLKQNEMGGRGRIRSKSEEA